MTRGTHEGRRRSAYEYCLEGPCCSIAPECAANASLAPILQDTVGFLERLDLLLPLRHALLVSFLASHALGMKILQSLLRKGKFGLCSLLVLHELHQFVFEVCNLSFHYGFRILLLRCVLLDVRLE